MKKVFSIFLLILLAGCSGPQIELQEVTNESIITDIPEIIEVTEETVEEDIAPYYTFSEEESKEVLGSTVTMVKISQGPEIEIKVDDKETIIKDTKSEEIVG